MTVLSCWSRSVWPPAPVVALGFTRFAYALLLPAMRHELSWNYAAAGGMNTANALGLSR